MLYDPPETSVEVKAVAGFLAGYSGRTREAYTLDLRTFYRYAAEEGMIEHSPAVHVRRPRLDYESHAVGLDRNELGAIKSCRCGFIRPRSVS